MNSISKYRSIIDSATVKPITPLEESCLRLPSDEIFELDEGMNVMIMYLNKDTLDEGIADTLGGLFQGAKNSMVDLAKGTDDKFRRTMRKVTSKFSGNMNRDMKKQVKAITKKLKDKYYFDYNLTIQSFEKQNTLYSKKFFDELITSFGLDPDVHRLVLKEFKPQINKLVKGIIDLYKEYASNNPEARKLPRQSMAFTFLPKRLKKKVIDDVNYLVGSIIGYTAAVSIADYFQKNPAKFKSTNEAVMESVNHDVSDMMHTKITNELFEDIKMFAENSIIERLEDMIDDEDEEFDWTDDIDEEHESIYTQYMEK